MEEVTIFELTQEYLETFREALNNQDDDFIRTSLESVRHEDVSALLEEFSADESKYIIELLEKEVASDVLEDLDEDSRSKFLTVFN